MKKYKSGRETKEKILNAARELFYEKGYKNTTYSDICDKAEVNTGTFHYHFQTKGKIAGIIYNNFMFNIKEETAKLISSKYEDDLKLCTALEITTYMGLFFRDEHIKTFFYDLYSENIPQQYSLEFMENFFQLHVERFKLPIERPMVKTIAATNQGVEQALIINYCCGYLTQSPQEIIDYDIEMTYAQMNIDHNEIRRIIDLAQSLGKWIQLRHANYFKVESLHLKK